MAKPDTSAVRYSALPHFSGEIKKESHFFSSNFDGSITMKIHTPLLLRGLGLLFSILCLVFSVSDLRSEYHIAIYSISIAVHLVQVLSLVLRETLNPYSGWSNSQALQGWRVTVVLKNSITGETKDWYSLNDQTPSKRFYSIVGLFLDAALVVCGIVAVVLESNNAAIAVVGSFVILCHFFILFSFLHPFFLVIGCGFDKPTTSDVVAASSQEGIAERYRDEPTTEEVARTTVDV